VTIDLPGLIDSYGYFAVFIGAFLEGETILALAGLAAHRGYMDFWVVVTVALFAGFLGDQFFFYLGRFKGTEILARFPKMAARAQHFDAMLERWHAPLIVCIRFMYGFRILGPIMLGMGRVPAWKFLVYNLLGAAIGRPDRGGRHLFGSFLQSVRSLRGRAVGVACVSRARHRRAPRDAIRNSAGCAGALEPSWGRRLALIAAVLVPPRHRNKDPYADLKPGRCSTKPNGCFASAISTAPTGPFASVSNASRVSA
jgi:membrane protein YqaA with SNARE-associated domain